MYSNNSVRYIFNSYSRGALHSKNPVHFVKKSGKNPNKSGKSNRFSLQVSGKNPRIFKNPKIPYASFKNPENPNKSGKSNRFSLQKSAKKSGKIRKKIRGFLKIRKSRTLFWSEMPLGYSL
jgi:hypothetical protein